MRPMGETASHYMRLATFFRGMGHPTRLRILERIVAGEFCVSDLETDLDRRQANISQHLAILRDRGLVIPIRKGKTVCYRLADGRIADLIHQVKDILDLAPDKESVP
jgi:DNA-binding transcriptional ArsR family regulator